jgi:hypothetical protein
MYLGTKASAELSPKVHYSYSTLKNKVINKKPSEVVDGQDKRKKFTSQ